MSTLHGLKYLIQAIALRFHDAQLSPSIQELYNALLNPLVHSMMPANIPDIFVACFSGETDTLTHWIEYGQHGVGYAIGFDTGRLVSATTANALLTRCIYKDETKIRLLLHTLRVAETAFTDVIAKNGGTPIAELAAHFIPILLTAIVWFGPVFKHAIFEPEQEWRLITKDHPKSRCPIYCAAQRSEGNSKAVAR